MESANTLMYALRSSFKTVRNAVGERRGNAARMTGNDRFLAIGALHKRCLKRGCKNAVPVSVLMLSRA